MSIELANNLMASFGLTIGIEGLCLDDQGYCCLQIDALDVHLQYDPAQDSLILFARLGPLDEESLADGCVWMMKSNLFWAGTNGATLALQPDSNQVFLQTRTSIRDMDTARFERWMSDFVGSAERWVANLAQINTGAPVAAPQLGAMPGAGALFV